VPILVKGLATRRTAQIEGVAPTGSMVMSRQPTRTGAALDMGVRGFDFDDRGGGSEPTSPERRKKVGNVQKCQH
jgi:hypothetical protein